MSLFAVSGAGKTLLFVFFLVLVPLVPITFLLARRLSNRRVHPMATGRDMATPFRVITWVGGTITVAVFTVLLIVLGAQWIVSENGDSVDPQKGNDEPAFTDPSDTQAVQGDAAAGKRLFASSGCRGCHTLADADARGTTGPSLDEDQPDFATVIACLTTGPGEMPVFSSRLSPAEIRNIASTSPRQLTPETRRRVVLDGPLQWAATQGVIHWSRAIRLATLARGYAAAGWGC